MVFVLNPASSWANVTNEAAIPTARKVALGPIDSMERRLELLKL